MELATKWARQEADWEEGDRVVNMASQIRIVSKMHAEEIEVSAICAVRACQVYTPSSGSV